MATKEEKKLTWQEYVIENARKKNKPLPEWFDGIVKHIASCKLATHVGKFAHPDVQESVLVDYCPKSLGYVMTQNTKCKADILVPAQYLGSAGLLLADFNTSENVMEAVLHHPEEMQKGLEELSLPSEELCKVVNEIKKESMKPPEKTDRNLKQIHFIIGKGEYHQLTILPSSSLAIELKKRIRLMSEQKRKSLDKNSEEYGKPYREMKQLTVIGYGGTNPQNISTLNSRQSGKGYLLYSMPPELVNKNIKCPKRDYFREVVYYKQREGVFTALQHCIQLDRNNVAIRDKIDELADALIEYVMNGVYTLRINSTGWTNEEKYKELNPMQKIWLDEEYRDKRDNPEWMEKISEQFARWVLYYFERQTGENKVSLGGEEFRYFRNKMRTLLEEEVRYSL